VIFGGFGGRGARGKRWRTEGRCTCGVVGAKKRGRGKIWRRRGRHPFKGVRRGGSGGGSGRRGRHACAGGQRCPNRGAPASDAWAPAGSGRERERRGTGRVGRPERKRRSGPSPDEQESFRFIQINFKLVRIVLIKR
jgi:hypothetical protein